MKGGIDEQVHVIQDEGAGAERLTLSFDLARTAAGGNRTVNIQVTDDVIVSIRFFVERDPQVCSAACVPPRRCEIGVCKLPE
jgi:hypothetical protein